MNELELLSGVKKIIHRHLGTDVEIVLFGSRATHKAVTWSDYDIGLRAKQTVEPYIMATINNEVEELPTLRKIDIVDLTEVTPRFYATAMEHTRAI